MFTDKRYQEVSGVFIFSLSILIFLALFTYGVSDFHLLLAKKNVVNLIGPIGALVAHGLRTAFGISAYLIPAMLALAGWYIIKHGNLSEAFERIFAILFFIVSSSALISIFSAGMPQLSSGYVGLYIKKFLSSVMGSVGAYLVIAVINMAGLILLGLISVTTILELAGRNSEFSRKIKGFLSRFSHKAYEKNLPFITIDDSSRVKGSRLPWITKKIIGEDTDSLSGIPVRYIEMDPAELSFVSPVQAMQEPAPVKVDKGSDIYTLPDEIFYRDSDAQSFEVISLEKAEPRECEPCIASAEPASTVEIIEVEKINEEKIVPDFLEDDQAMEIDEPEQLDYAEDRRLEDAAVAADSSVEKVFDEIKINKEYIIPTGFLNSTVHGDSESWKNEIRQNSILLVKTLADFGIESKVINVNRGPVITLYELQIAPGIKVNRVVGLADDIAMALAAYRVRIVAPIPGKSAIGVEIPNADRESVTIGDIIKSEEYQSKTGLLKVALGKDILGKPITLDLKKQPHLLIAGATGSGKSVCVNSIITSLIYNYDPNYVRFIMVDPKMVELQLYNGLPHLLTPVITEPVQTPMVLKWALYEMERRYRLLSELNTRDIDRYNEKVSVKGSRRERLPYILIIIDELADLMMVASKEIEGYITRIAQKARAIGIHLVLATQRPSVDVITGIIKANFPARIAFQVAQKTDSRTIIDQNGAEKLLGRGDMLYQSPFSSYPIRIQGAFISEDEIMQIVNHLKKFSAPNYIDIDKSISEAEEDFALEDNGDELFVEALKIVEETRKASASYLQRRLSIGYNRAARIIELMEERGYIGPQQGSKPREILI